jgi:hypothetical protein
LPDDEKVKKLAVDGARLAGALGAVNVYTA